MVPKVFKPLKFYLMSCDWFCHAFIICHVCNCRTPQDDQTRLPTELSRQAHQGQMRREVERTIEPSLKDRQSPRDKPDRLKAKSPLHVREQVTVFISYALKRT